MNWINHSLITFIELFEHAKFSQDDFCMPVIHSSQLAHAHNFLWSSSTDNWEIRWQHQQVTSIWSPNHNTPIWLTHTFAVFFNNMSLICSCCCYAGPSTSASTSCHQRFTSLSSALSVYLSQKSHHPWTPPSPLTRLHGGIFVRADFPKSQNLPARDKDLLKRVGYHIICPESFFSPFTHLPLLVELLYYSVPFSLLVVCHWPWWLSQVCFCLFPGFFSLLTISSKDFTVVCFG